MKEDFDYVTMNNYSKDMEDLTNISANITASLIKERDELKACIAFLVKAAGKITIQQNFQYVDAPPYEISKDEYHDTLIFRTTDN